MNLVLTKEELEILLTALDMYETHIRVDLLEAHDSSAPEWAERYRLCCSLMDLLWDGRNSISDTPR
jgi:hypothetical protein